MNNIIFPFRAQFVSSGDDRSFFFFRLPIPVERLESCVRLCRRFRITLRHTSTTRLVRGVRLGGEMDHTGTTAAAAAAADLIIGFVIGRPACQARAQQRRNNNRCRRRCIVFRRRLAVIGLERIERN